MVHFSIFAILQVYVTNQQSLKDWLVELQLQRWTSTHVEAKHSFCLLKSCCEFMQLTTEVRAISW